MNFLKIFLNWSGRYLEKSSSAKEIQKLIEKMKPVGSFHQLVRLGDEHDGGYVIPDDLKEVKYCFSAGVGDLIKFEEDLLKRYKIKSFLCDFNNVKDPRITNHFDFTQKKIGSYNDNQTTSINSWIDDKVENNKEEFILKIDIEGSEFETLLNLIEKHMQKTRVLIVEFHSLRDLRNKSFYRIFDNVISKLLNYFYIVHLHPNNAGKNIKIHNYNVPDLLEVTFLRKDRVEKKKKYTSVLPLNIDQKNVKNKDDIFLDPIWHN